MTFQTEVREEQTTGIIGEIIFDGPQRARPAILESTAPANNVIGRAMFHLAGDDNKVSAEDADTLVFAGILANPKAYATSGPASGSLDPTLILPNASDVELLEMGIIIINSSTAGDIGDAAWADNLTGALALGPTGVPIAGHTEIPGSKVVRNNIPGAGLAIIQLT